MICGAKAPTAGLYMPAQQLPPPPVPGCAERQLGDMECTPPRIESERSAPSAPQENWFAPPLPPPPMPVVPCYCPKHDESAKRPKSMPAQRDCTSCGIGVQTSYTDLALCPACSERKRQCMICGIDALVAAQHQPPHNLQANCVGDEPDYFTTTELFPRPQANEQRSRDLQDREVSHGNCREGSAAAGAGIIGEKLGCGMPCAGHAQPNFMHFLHNFDFQNFDFHAWTRCMASDQNSRPETEYYDPRAFGSSTRYRRGGA